MVRRSSRLQARRESNDKTDDQTARRESNDKTDDQAYFRDSVFAVKRAVVSDQRADSRSTVTAEEFIALVSGEKPATPKPSLLPIYFSLFVGCLSLFLVSPVRVQTVLKLGGNATLMGTRGACTGVTNLIISASIGSVLDRFGRKPIMMLLTMMLSLGWYVNSQTTDLYVFMAFSSITWSYGNSMKIISKYMVTDIVSDPTERSQRSAMVEVVFTTGMMVGPLTGGILSKTHNVWQISYMLSSCVMLLMAVILTETRPASVRKSNTNVNNAATNDTEAVCGWYDYIMLVLITVFSFVPMTVLIGCMNTFAVTVLKADSASVGQTMMACTGMATITQLILPSLTTNVSGKTRVVVSMVTTAIALFMSIQMQSDYKMWVVCMMAGWCLSAQGRNGVEDLIQASIPGGKGHSFMAVIGAVVQMSMGIINGYLMDNGYSVWFFGACLCICSAFFTILYTPTKSQRYGD